MYVCMYVYVCVSVSVCVCVCVMFIFMYTDSLKTNLYLTENAVCVD